MFKNFALSLFMRKRKIVFAVGVIILIIAIFFIIQKYSLIQFSSGANSVTATMSATSSKNVLLGSDTYTVRGLGYTYLSSTKDVSFNILKKGTSITQSVSKLSIGQEIQLTNFGNILLKISNIYKSGKYVYVTFELKKIDTPILTSLNINSNPTGAYIYIDGVRKGITPLNIELTPGKYKVILHKDSYPCDWENNNVEIVAGETKTISGAFSSTCNDDGAGTYYFTSNIPQVKVYEGGTYYGTTPVYAQIFRSAGLSLEFKKTGYNDGYKSIQPNDKYTIDYSIVLNPTNLTGKINATSNPSGVYVYLDGTYKGVTPKIIDDVLEGKHNLTFNAPSYVSGIPSGVSRIQSLFVNVTKGKTLPVFLNYSSIIPSPTMGVIVADSSPSNVVNVYIGSSYKGLTPETINNVAPGYTSVKFIYGSKIKYDYVNVEAGKISYAYVSFY